MFHFLFHRHDTAVRNRMMTAKVCGLFLGALCFVLTPVFVPGGVSDSLRWGLLLWYITFGGVVGASGLVKTMALPSFLRGALVGIWMNLVLGVIAYPQLLDLFNQISFLAPFGVFPHLLVEGAILGGLIDVVATKVEDSY